MELDYKQFSAFVKFMQDFERTKGRKPKHNDFKVNFPKLKVALYRNLEFLDENLSSLEGVFLASASIKERRLAAYLKQEHAKNRSLLLDLEESEKRNDFLLGITDYKKVNVIPSIVDNPDIVSEATAISILSDVHCEERVDKDVIYGLNEYNLDIAKKRMHKYFVNLLKTINKERQNIQIDNLVLGLLGDFITGYIHEELRESNYLSPTEAVLFIQELLMSGLKFLAEDGKFKKIIIPCTKGNHGRNTDRKRFATAYKNSYEWMMYKSLESAFKTIGGYECIEFEIPKSELVHIPIYNKVNRFGHGDHFKFMGGVGGLAIPLMKWLYRMQDQVNADMTFIGHWHQQIKPAQNCLVNGSLIGFNAYTSSLGCRPEAPMQQFLLLDKKRGYTVNTPILCD
jgi:hypothetical protein